MNVKELFIKSGKRDIVWKKNEKKFKQWFKANLILLKTMDENPNEFNNDYREKAFYRLMSGYYGVGCGNGFSLGLVSNDAKNKKCKTTPDHIFGASEVGKEVCIVFRNSSYNMEWMLNEWLYDNIHLFGTIKVTKEEHKKENILRNKHTLEEKNQLKHYINFSGLSNS